VSVYDAGVDWIGGLLEAPRAQGAFLLRSTFEPPWSLRIQDEAPLSVMAVVQGSAWVVPDDRPPVQIEQGGVALFRGPDHYTVADAPSTAPQVVILPGQECFSPEGKPMDFFGVRDWGNAADGSTVLVTGTYPMPREVGRRVLSALPPIAVIPLDACRTVVQYLADEIVRDEPGQEAVLDRVLDLVLIAALRAWFARPEAQAPGWYRAQADPVVGAALRLIHDAPEQPWTVASLAAAGGVSRAAFARRFGELVGESPMTFLTDWRLTVAADLLREPESTLGSVARQVGYGSPYALSAAFKRVRGLSPRDYLARSEVVPV
jgi:AraC-like DNA-binding protein